MVYITHLYNYNITISLTIKILLQIRTQASQKIVLFFFDFHLMEHSFSYHLGINYHKLLKNDNFVIYLHTSQIK